MAEQVTIAMCWGQRLAQSLADLPEIFFLMSFNVKTLAELAKWLRHALLNQTDFNSRLGFDT